jgi:hypothetical protein
MKANELIKDLQRLVDIHGDLSVENEYGHVITAPEFNDDDGPCILVAFDTD